METYPFPLTDLVGHMTAPMGNTGQSLLSLSHRIADPTVRPDGRDYINSLPTPLPLPPRGAAVPQVKVPEAPLSAYDGRGFFSRLGGNIKSIGVGLKGGPPSGVGGRPSNPLGIHDANTLLNAGLAVNNMMQRTPPSISMDTPKASLVRYDRRPIDDMADKAIAGVRGAARDVSKTTKGVADKLTAQAISGAQIARITSQAAGQSIQAKQAVHSANAQILNQNAAQVAEVKNRERLVNREMKLRNAAAKGAAVSKNIADMTQSQLAKQQQIEMEKQARVNRAIQSEVLKFAVADKAFSSPEYEQFVTERRNEITQGIIGEIGAGDDLENPLFAKDMPTWKADFEKEIAADERFVAAGKEIEDARAKMERIRSGEEFPEMTDEKERAAALAKAEGEVGAMEARLAARRVLEEQDYLGKQAEAFHEAEAMRLMDERLDMAAIKEEYREANNIPSVDFETILKLGGVK